MPEELREQYQALNLDPFQYVFTNTKGEQLSKRNMRTMWDSFKKEMNIAMGCKIYRNEVLPFNYEAVKRNGMKPIFPVADDLVPYCLRHTFATDLRAAGVSIEDAKDLMGHADIKLLVKVYSHGSADSFARVASQMNEYQKKKNPIKMGVDSLVETEPQTVVK